MIDLHSHSTASDGELSPSALVMLAKKKGISALALTDHDTVNGIAEAQAAAAVLSESGAEIRLIPGVEIEIAFEPGEFHVLGLGIDPVNPAFLRAMEKLAQAREARNKHIVARMNEVDIPVKYEDIIAYAGTRHVGRPHLADYLVRIKTVRTRQDAFDRYLGKGKPLYFSKECLPFEEALALIHDAQGAAIVAHPYSLFVSKAKLAMLMDAWKESGVDGIEAYHPAAKLGQCKILERMARERNFIVTAGSDWHGAAHSECGLGHSAGNLPIDTRYLDELDSVLTPCHLYPAPSGRTD